MSLTLSEVARARRRLAVEKKRTKEAIRKLRHDRSAANMPVFASVRSAPPTAA